MYNNNDFCNWPLFYTHVYTHNQVAKRVKFLVFGAVFYFRNDRFRLINYL